MEKRSGLSAWIDERLNASPLLNAFLYRHVPQGVSWFQTLGFSSLVVFIVLAVTGIFLAMNYSPSPEQAYNSVQFISNEVVLGAFIRGVHHWAASAMVVLVFLHMLRVFFMAAYKYPRELTWTIGILLFLLVLGSSFTGYLLPWDQKAYWATTVGTEIASNVPYVGKYILELLRGGTDMGAQTLTRFFSFHVLLIPSLIALMISVHLFMVIRQGIAAPPKRLKEPFPPIGKSLSEAYQQDYGEAKAKGESFFPFAVYKDMTVALLVFAVIVALAILVGAETGAQADPTTTTYNPRPEWYFMFLFELLKLFPGSLESVGTVGVPTLAVVVLLALPFVDRSAKRHPLDRPVATAIGLFAVTGLALVTYIGLASPLTNPAEQGPVAAAGQQLYAETNCAFCHSIQGTGGTIGPDLSKIGNTLTKDQIAAYLKDPNAMIPHTLHPKLQFTDQEVQALSNYLASLGAPPPYTSEAPTLFQDNCASCHAVNGTGGKIGPDLSREGTFRDPTWLASFIADAKAQSPSTIMPAFKGKLTDAQINDLAAYLYSQKGPAAPNPAPTITPTPVDGGKISFSKDVQPIINQWCLACHGAAAQGGLDLRSYQSMTTTGANKPQIIAGNSQSSLLHQVLLGQQGDIPRMPFGSIMPAGQVDVIGKWIDQGASNN